MKRKVIVSGLFLIMFFCVTSVANASIMVSDYISDWRAGVYARSGGTLDIYFEVQAPDTMDKIGAKTIILQERVAGSSAWNPVETFSYTKDSGMLIKGTASHNYTVTYYNAVPGRSYRAKIYFYAEKGGYDTIEVITSAVKAK